MRLVYFALAWFYTPCLAGAGLVMPQLGGGQVDQAGGAAMKHADITLVGNTLSVYLDSSTPTPLLRPLSAPDQFDSAMPWAVLQDKAHNFQYGWNPSGFWAPPSGSAVWIENVDSSPGLEVYHVDTLPLWEPYDPIFGTTGSPLRWKWSESMTHNAYAVLDPVERNYYATYRVYIGDENTGTETTGYNSAEVQFNFLAIPSLTADFNDDEHVDGADLAIWQQHYGMTNGALSELGDTNSDFDVDGHDLLNWQQQFSGSTVGAHIAHVPEPNGIWMAIAALSIVGGRRR